MSGLQTLATRDADSPLSLHDLRCAQQGVLTLVHTQLCPALLPGVGPPPPRLTGSKPPAAPDLLSALRSLSAVWHNAALRTTVAARHLPFELAGLLQATAVPAATASANAGPTDAAWCEERLRELIQSDHPLALLEALAAIMRSHGAPGWLRGNVVANRTQSLQPLPTAL